MKLIKPGIYFFIILFFISIFSSCVNTKNVAYFNDVKDSALIASKSGLEPVIQKKDLLSISVSSLSNAATIVFNAPNAASSGGSTGAPTTGYLVSQDGTIKFPMLGDIPAAGLTQKELEDN
ncbi:MAG TPA: polysaccharide biosynthesis/export family protein, partial [Hanamia sp.]|nr:polysaccharide biosynthesis/export family protein [Hanamia sp.]